MRRPISGSGQRPPTSIAGLDEQIVRAIVAYGAHAVCAERLKRMLDSQKRITVYVSIPKDAGRSVFEQVDDFLDALAYTGGGVSSRYEDGIWHNPETGEAEHDITLVASVLIARDGTEAGKTAVIAVAAKQFASDMGQEAFMLTAEDVLGSIIYTDTEGF